MTEVIGCEAGLVSLEEVFTRNKLIHFALYETSRQTAAGKWNKEFKDEHNPTNRQYTMHYYSRLCKLALTIHSPVSTKREVRKRTTWRHKCV